MLQVLILSEATGSPRSVSALVSLQVAVLKSVPIFSETETGSRPRSDIDIEEDLKIKGQQVIQNAETLCISQALADD